MERPTNFITNILTGTASILTGIAKNPILLILVIIVVGGGYVYLKYYRNRE